MLLRNRALLITAHLWLIIVLLEGCSEVQGSHNPTAAVPRTREISLPASIPPVNNTPTSQPAAPAVTAPAGFVSKLQVQAVSATPEGEPAGCLSAQAQSALSDPQKMFAYADSLLALDRPLSTRRLVGVWNAYTEKNLLDGSVVALAVDDVQNKYLLQRMMNALQVAGFVTWLRKSPQKGLQILAIPLIGSPTNGSPWQSYIKAYWQSRQSMPADQWALASLKIPPCDWEIARGFAPPFGADWWKPVPAAWPDYAHAAAAYLADSSQAADQVARRIHWLGADGGESPTTMCGPLVWSQMQDSGALPPDWGGWSDGPRSFWLSKPVVNGRPWSLFPAGLGHVYSFHQPLGSFDFSTFALYPGDFFYTYSSGDGFDHMFLVTEVDSAGNVYTVTNLIQTVPIHEATIQRVLLLNLNDPSVGIARNQWAKDRVHGRTGHAGFDVFRWAWMEKDISGRSAVVTVQPGDTLNLIAERWKTPADQIARYNGITVDAALSLGQEVRIPPLEIKGR